MSQEPARQIPSRAMDTSAENPWPLRLLNKNLADYISKLPGLWVEGQLVQINRRPGASMAFMTLRDTDVDMSINLSILARNLGDMDLRDGARVIVQAKPTFWSKRGTLQLQANEIRPVGLGDLLARIELLKKMLAAEGLFDADRKRPLPVLPRVVGLVCGRESKAEHDVVVNARDRWPQVRFEIREVAVQGAHAVAEVSEALADLDARPEVDVIVVARGGGSVEDLLPFSNEHLIRVVAACTTPIVSAIGHETDYPLLDLVADYRASTPTDAAKRIVPSMNDELAGLANTRARGRSAVIARINQESSALAALRSRPVLAEPQALLVPHAERLARATEDLRRAWDRRVTAARSELDRLRAAVVALSPASTLNRGYAVVRDSERRVLTDATGVELGATLDIRLAAGSLSATVTERTP